MYLCPPARGYFARIPFQANKETRKERKSIFAFVTAEEIYGIAFVVSLRTIFCVSTLGCLNAKKEKGRKCATKWYLITTNLCVWPREACFCYDSRRRYVSSNYRWLNHSRTFTWRAWQTIEDWLLRVSESKSQKEINYVALEGFHEGVNETRKNSECVQTMH